MICVYWGVLTKSPIYEFGKCTEVRICEKHDDVIKWKYFPHYWPLWEEPPVTGEFPSQRPLTRNFNIFFDLRLNQQLSKQCRRRWFETPSRSLWRHCNEYRTTLSCRCLRWACDLQPLAPARYPCNLKLIIFKLISRIDIIITMTS